MTMNSKQHFSMHPALHEPKYPGLHSGTEGMRRVCLPAPQVRFRSGEKGWEAQVKGGKYVTVENVCKVDVTGLCSTPLSPPPAPLCHPTPLPHVCSSNALAFILIFMTCALRRVLASPRRCLLLENVF